VYFDAVTDKGHGFVMDTHGSFTTIDVPGAIYTFATGINNLGQIVGDYAVHPSQYPNQEQNRGFIRDTDGTITLFDAPYFGSTMPNGIADNGTIAASFSRTSGNYPPNAGLFRKCILCP
jgi:hypothetical protein